MGIKRKVGEIKGKKEMKELRGTREGNGKNRKENVFFKNEELKRKDRKAERNK